MHFSTFVAITSLLLVGICVSELLFAPRETPVRAKAKRDSNSSGRSE